MLTDEGTVLRLDDVMHAASHNTDEIELAFLTPTSIKVNGKWTNNLTFEHFIRNLLRRIRFLSYFHCGEDLDIDARGLIEASTSVDHDSRLKWLRRDRYSYRAEKSVPMGGFIGKVRFEGKLEPFLPFIYLGEYLHIGHHTAFGFGQYRLTASCENDQRIETCLVWERPLVAIPVTQPFSRRFSNHCSTSDCFTIPRPKRITKITAIQITKRNACLMIPIMRSTANMAAIIKNSGELINSGISHPVSSQ